MCTQTAATGKFLAVDLDPRTTFIIYRQCTFILGGRLSPLFLNTVG